MVRMDRITLEKNYSWPSPTRRRSLLRSSVLRKDSFAPAAGSSAIHTMHYDSVTGSGSQNPCERFDPALEHDLGGSDSNSGDMARTVSPETDLKGGSMCAADDEATTGGTQRSHQKGTRNTSGVTGCNQHCVQKKCASVRRRQIFEYSRLGAVREGADGRIQFMICWKTTWGSLEDPRGTRALKEAEELTINDYDQYTWDEETRRSGLNVDAKTE